MEFRKFRSLTVRNCKRYFGDRFLFLVSLITPMILLVLFVTFLRSTYISSFEEIFAAFDFAPPKSVVEGLAGSWLLSSVVAVCSVTVAICSNAVMVKDKAEGMFDDLMVAPVKGTTVSLAYFAANFLVTSLIMLAVLAVVFVYLAAAGWYLSFGRIVIIILDLVLCALFGTLLAGVAESCIKSQSAVSALSALVSAMYGFICGAYIPLSQFSEGIRTFVCFLPGTYSVGIVRNDFMTDYVSELVELGLPEEGAKAILDAFDGNLYVFGSQVPHWAMYVIVAAACAALLVAYVSIVFIAQRKRVGKLRTSAENAKLAQ